MVVVVAAMVLVQEVRLKRSLKMETVVMEVKKRCVNIFLGNFFFRLYHLKALFLLFIFRIVTKQASA